MLRISLFEGGRVTHDGIPSVAPPARAVKVLLAYLLLHRRRLHSRESLLGIFWGDHDEESARGCLNTTLWRLRRVLEPKGVVRGTYLITTAGGEVGFNDQSPHWLDVSELERCARVVADTPEEAISAADIKHLEQAVELYVGDILDGVYDDWALRERERLRAMYLHSQEHLMRYHKCHGAPERGIDHARAILRHDPLREEVHRELIRMHLVLGSRAQAAQQYDTCRNLLAEELGVEPMSETRSLLTAIRSSRIENTSADAAVTGVTALTLELRNAAETVERALACLREVVERVERAMNSPKPY